eukprot:Nitzschia sp. Nitz4//scaffold83_size84149//6316//8325//NITZ4_005162-RA/size84149-processed-gene-0.69-mRNA-1//1//CDS//3329558911//7781//frame0
MLEVAVIGAGPAGLVASRHLVGQGLRPCVFEATKTLGGAWKALGTKMWDGMTTNLSRHTCQFSEWPWPEGSPTFPTVPDMESYLESYSKNFLDPSCFQYQCQVTKVAPLPERGYRVDWTDMASATSHSKDFEGVVVASGFFSNPRYPNGFDMSDPSLHDFVVHSSDYQTSAAFVDQTVAVVGSSFSALEIATDVSTTAKHVLHVVPSIPWVVPRYIPHKMATNQLDPLGATTILPTDLSFYQRKRDAPQIPEQILMTPQTSRLRHEALYATVGSRQATTPLGIPQNWEDPPKVVISDYYLDLTVQGDIEVVRGHLRGISSDSGETKTSTCKIETPTGQTRLLPNVDKVICCTGYESQLPFLDNSILDTLRFDPQNMHSPMTTCWETMHPDLPDMFFCGMYRGPYMGIMELQGRLAAGVLSGNVKVEKQKLDAALEVSEQIRSQDPRPQFPHFDYIGMMDTLSDIVQGDSVPTMHTSKGDIVTPAFYQGDKNLSEKESDELEMEVKRGLDGSRIPKLVLSALIGSWNFERNIVHFGNGHRERVYGEVRYSRPSLDHVLYREDGFYELSKTQKLNVFREYEYEVSGDCLVIYFVEAGQRAHVFLSLKFSKKEGDYWIATSDHLCIKDLYKAHFRVKLNGMEATELEMTYRVKGPKKDYESTTILTPKASVY